MSRVTKIIKHDDETKIDEFLKENNNTYRVYRKVLLIKLVLNGMTVKEAAEKIGVTRQTGAEWVRNYNENGLKGLETKYANCGKKCRLTKPQLSKLKDILTTTEKYYTLKEIKQLVKEEFDEDYSERQISTIIKEKLNLTYGKPFIQYNTKPTNAKEDLKKKLNI